MSGHGTKPVNPGRFFLVRTGGLGGGDSVGESHLTKVSTSPRLLEDPVGLADLERDLNEKPLGAVPDPEEPSPAF